MIIIYYIKPKVGITERGDPSLNFDWVSKLLCLNIIITKNLTSEMIKHLTNNKTRIILHITCTGFGGSNIEPNIPTIKETYVQICRLIAAGFPTEQIVLRIDPIIPTKFMAEHGLVYILDTFKDTGITRVRYSFLDIYKHVKERFEQANIKLPYETFHCPVYMQERILQIFDEYTDIYQFESCAENTHHALGCVSHVDFDILGIKIGHVNSKGTQRKLCLCFSGKTELLDKRSQCAYGCLYCYWKSK